MNPISIFEYWKKEKHELETFMGWIEAFVCLEADKDVGPSDCPNSAIRGKEWTSIDFEGIKNRNGMVPNDTRGSWAYGNPTMRKHLVRKKIHSAGKMQGWQARVSKHW